MQVYERNANDAREDSRFPAWQAEARSLGQQVMKPRAALAELTASGSFIPLRHDQAADRFHDALNAARALIQEETDAT